MTVTALVLAGGQGSRISGLYPDLPKPLVLAAGQPFLYWVTRWLAGQGVTHIVFATGYRAGQVHQWADGLAQETALHIEYRAEPTPLGTGGAVGQCLDLCRETVLIVNGDSLTLTSLTPVRDRLHADALDGVMVGTPMADTSRYGSLDVGGDGLLHGFHEKVPGRGLINCGLYLFRRDVLGSLARGQACSIEADLLPEALRRGYRIGVDDASRAAGGGAFLDIGTPETVRQADAFIAAHKSAFPALPVVVAKGSTADVL